MNVLKAGFVLFILGVTVFEMFSFTQAIEQMDLFLSIKEGVFFIVFLLLTYRLIDDFDKD